jgi:hypothetical protein
MRALLAAGGGGAVVFIYLLFIVLYIAGFWALFAKAGQPGWAAIIPIYNYYIFTKINGRSGVWTIVYLIPIIGLILLGLDVAKSFGKTTGFAIGLILLPIIFYPILGFGSSTYQGPAAQQA